MKGGDEQAFTEIYNRYWERLYTYVFNRLRSHELAFELVQEFFVSLWSRREELQLHTSLSGYLYASMRYQIIAHIRHSKVRSRYLDEFENFRTALVDNSNEETLQLHELEHAVERSLEKLPPRCRDIFKLSRQQNKSIKEIAQQFNISHKTVENQLTYALKHLRVSLGEFMVMVFLVLF